MLLKHLLITNDEHQLFSVTFRPLSCRCSDVYFLQYYFNLSKDLKEKLFFSVLVPVLILETPSIFLPSPNPAGLGLTSEVTTLR